MHRDSITWETTEDETINLQLRECQRLLTTTRSQGRHLEQLLPRKLWQKPSIQTSWPPTSRLQNCEAVRFCHLGQPIFSTFQPQPIYTSPLIYHCCAICSTWGKMVFPQTDMAKLFPFQTKDISTNYLLKRAQTYGFPMNHLRTWEPQELCMTIPTGNPAYRRLFLSLTSSHWSPWLCNWFSFITSRIYYVQTIVSV